MVTLTLLYTEALANTGVWFYNTDLFLRTYFNARNTFFILYLFCFSVWREFQNFDFVNLHILIFCEFRYVEVRMLYSLSKGMLIFASIWCCSPSPPCSYEASTQSLAGHV